MRTLFLIIMASLACGLPAAEPVEFNRDVRAILSNKCFQCHGPDSATREAGLRLDVRESAVGEADSGETAIVPGDVNASELIRRVMTDDADVRMPPTESASGEGLSAEEIDVLKRWIAEGAAYQKHWSFESPKAPSLPEVQNSQWPKNEIDHFVLARLQQAGLSPKPSATREALIRRVAFDLTGLPPTLAEIDRFIEDESAEAYALMIDRYLKSSAYGEHMARQWMDLARYADSNGYQYDTERQQWIWRDWVIDAYNRNMPFDQFTVEQIAGDLLPDATPEQRLATGFNRNHGITIEGGIIDEEYRVEYVMDRISTVGNVWMGLTLGCARCHDHKFDPISQKEFYQLYAFFNQVPEKGMRGFTPSEKIASPLARQQTSDIDREILAVEKQLAAPIDIDAPLAAWAKGLDSRSGWQVVRPTQMKSSGGSTLTRLEDDSVLAGNANPRKDIYDITAETDLTKLTAVRLQCLTHESLPGGGPGRHSNSNFVLSEFELTAVSIKDPEQTRKVTFRKAIADYSQKGYEVAKAIDGTVAGNNGWAVDGPSRKEPATALLIADEAFGFDGGTRLEFRLRHEAGFATHGIGRPRISVTTDPAETVDFGGLPREITELASRPIDTLSKDDAQRLRDYFLKHHDPKQKLRDRLAELKAKRNAGVPATMVMQDMPSARKTFVLNRGQYNEPTDEVSAAVPAVFTRLAAEAPRNRLGFARWLTAPTHPLTARVTVNRYWQRIFGVGLVKTSEDFGVQGELPSHPELLDWLASEFIRSGWDVKAMQKRILMSATYRQSAHAGTASYESDPENRLLARGPRHRLTAEEIRDNALAVSGLLVNRLGGRSVYTYQPDGLWLELNNRPGYSKKYEAGTGDDLYRRSLYTFWKRTVPSPMMKTLDAPSREFCTINRSRTNTPLQSLLLLNGPQFVEAARHLASRIIEHGGQSPDDRIAYAFRVVTARRASAAEVALIRTIYDSAIARFTKDEQLAKQLLSVGASASETDHPPATLAAWTTVARLLLNLDETITK